MFLRNLFILILTLVACSPALAQVEAEDSIHSLSEVTIRAFEQNARERSASAVVKVINIPIPFNNKVSLVQPFNHVPGVRMEERSPGSYRINIRGSSLRSPFGVRNVKVYWNDLPMTDPGGNTYFSQLAHNNLSSVQIFKGPASSMYGQGTGGLVLVDNKPGYHKTGVEYMAGSYNYHNLMANATWGSDSTGISAVSFTHNVGDGYREQTALRRDNISWTSEMKINNKHSLRASALYADLYYQTPGGLTLAEFQQDPRASRPAVGSFPSAKDINASIRQKTFMAGITHTNTISQTLNHKTAIYGAFAQLKNAAVRNFERRNEPHFGARSILSFKKDFGATGRNIFKWDNGVEFQQGYFNTQVSDNKNGGPDTLQTNDDISSTVLSFMTQGNLEFDQKWILTAGVSINTNKLTFTRLSNYPVTQQTFRFNNEWAPRIALRHNFIGDWSLIGSVAKGFSPPTIAELLPSTGIITPLQAEYGWNYELAMKKYFRALHLNVELTGFVFTLNDALVQRRDEAGADYFVNAGRVNQKGVEAYLSQTIIPRESSFVDYALSNIGYTLSLFNYGYFMKDDDDFTGNTVPGVPQHCFSYSGNIFFKNGLHAHATFYAASEMFLNDANTASAKQYSLLGGRLGWKRSLGKRVKGDIYVGADNLLDQVYSLGNDINAAGGRYYNLAPGRNYFAGIVLQLDRTKPAKQN